MLWLGAHALGEGQGEAKLSSEKLFVSRKAEEGQGSAISKWCFQKILVLVCQMEESKQNTWMGVNSFTEEGESPVLPG
jgi:hypothetical protein